MFAGFGFQLPKQGVRSGHAEEHYRRAGDGGGEDDDRCDADQGVGETVDCEWKEDADGFPSPDRQPRPSGTVSDMALCLAHRSLDWPLISCASNTKW